MPLRTPILEYSPNIPTRSNLAAMADDEAHVWRLPVNIGAFPLDQDVISSDEMERASRFGHTHDQNRYHAFRNGLRHILSLYVGLPARELRFTYGAHGKPSLAHAGSDICFNLTHTRDFGLLAVTRAREVGVDVERLRAVPYAANIANRYFQPADLKCLETIDASQRDRFFLVCWTRLEARLKAEGLGLARWAAQQKQNTSKTSASRLVLISFEPAPGFVGSLAVAGGNIRLSCWDISSGRLPDLQYGG
jgi:4'-phosphopantetheinyl transferase